MNIKKILVLLCALYTTANHTAEAKKPSPRPKEMTEENVGRLAQEVTNGSRVLYGPDTVAQNLERSPFSDLKDACIKKFPQDALYPTILIYLNAALVVHEVRGTNDYKAVKALTQTLLKNSPQGLLWVKTGAKW